MFIPPIIIINRWSHRWHNPCPHSHEFLIRAVIRSDRRENKQYKFVPTKTGPWAMGWDGSIIAVPSDVGQENSSLFRIFLHDELIPSPSYGTIPHLTHAIAISKSFPNQQLVGSHFRPLHLFQSGTRFINFPRLGIGVHQRGAGERLTPR